MFLLLAVAVSSVWGEIRTEYLTKCEFLWDLSDDAFNTTEFESAATAALVYNSHSFSTLLTQSVDHKFNVSASLIAASDACSNSTAGIRMLVNVHTGTTNYRSCFQLFSSSSLEYLTETLGKQTRNPAVTLEHLWSVRSLNTTSYQAEHTAQTRETRLAEKWDAFTKPFHKSFRQFSQDHWYSLCFSLGVLFYGMFMCSWRIKRKCCRNTSATASSNGANTEKPLQGKVVV